jgi:hypothetical protein
LRRFAGILQAETCGSSARGSEGETIILKSANGLSSTESNEVKRLLPHIFVSVFHHHPDAIIDGTDRTDQVVTQPGTKKRAQFQIIHSRNSIN